ncbi:MAG: hypothetical protein AMXMBFR13_18430 [Phycisphaerae bacterium]
MQLGFQGSGSESERGTDHVRVGCYTPITVELVNDEGDTFAGFLEARQKDRDGDEVVARRDIAVAGQREYRLYIPAGDVDERSPFTIRVLTGQGSLAEVHDDQNRPVRELAPERSIQPVKTDACVVLDISEPPVNTLGSLVGDTSLDRQVVVIRCAPGDLPDLPVGLEMADIIVWNSADPSVIDVGQRSALLEWTRRGGSLLLGVGRNWEIVSKSSLGETLPAKLSTPETMDRLIEPWADGLGDPIQTALNPVLTYSPVRSEGLLPRALPVIPAEPKAEDPILLARSAFGRGDVLLATVDVRELLLQLPADRQKAFLLRSLGLRAKERTSGQQDSPYPRENLFRFIEQRTGFQVTTQVYLMFAFVFVVGYVAVATGGSWAWLRQRKMIHHAWAAFAVVAVVASVVSLAAVQMIRGIGHRVEELTIVDGEAGSPAVVASTYLGLKTAAHTIVDLRLASPEQIDQESSAQISTLRPLAMNPFSYGGTTYTAGLRYEAVPLLGELRAVPIRATLKQFEGTWCGDLSGQITASIRQEGGGTSLQPVSWIRNGLKADLDDCYLIAPVASMPWQVRRNMYEVKVYTFGKLAAGQRKSWLDVQNEYASVAARPGAQQKLDNRAIDLTELQSRLLSRLNIRTHDPYGSPYRNQRLDSIEELTKQLPSALILASTFEDIPRDQRSEVTLSQGWRLDRSRDLTRQTALFIGFSSDPGPAALCWRDPDNRQGRWRPIESEDGRVVVYRVAIPVGP